MKKIIMSLSLVSIFAFADEQQPANDSNWDSAKRSTETALQDIWNASKESTNKLVESSSETSKEIWESSKEKSGELWEKGKESSKEVWNDIESGSKGAWAEGKEKVDLLLEEDKDPITTRDEI